MLASTHFVSEMVYTREELAVFPLQTSSLLLELDDGSLVQLCLCLALSHGHQLHYLTARHTGPLTIPSSRPRSSVRRRSTSRIPAVCSST